MSYNNSKVKTNLLRQNCYKQDCVDPIKKLQEEQKEKQSSYINLVEKVENDGVKIIRTLEPYPITPEYVSSFAASCDYKQNLEIALNSPKKHNLGDVSSLQKVSQYSAEELQAFGEYLKSKQAKQSESVENSNTNIDNGVEK